MKVLVTGGGSAGHVLPALAIADALRDRGHDVTIVGSSRGLETRLVPEAGFPLIALPGRGIVRRIAWRNVGATIGLVAALVRAIALVRRERPAAVVAVGGYAAVACGLGAVLWRVPIVVHEQNAVPGATNRLLARFAAVSAVSFPDTDLPRPVVVGNPVRAALFEASHAPRTDGRRQILAFGGSLGALSINRAVLEAVGRWHHRGDLAVHHVVGSRDWDLVERPSDTGSLLYEAVEYEDDMPTRLAAADLVVCRAGAGTCFELAATASPAIIIPSEVTTGGQQLENARRVAATGGAVIVEDRALDGDRLVAEIDAVLSTDGRLAEMAAGISTMAAPLAATRVAELVEEHGRVGR